VPFAGGRIRKRSLRSENKYRAKRVEIDGHVFHSKIEAARYLELQLLERSGTITGLQLQPRFKLVVNDQPIATYVADFQYQENGKLIVEDVKGVITPAYRLKKKLMKALYGIDIYET